MARFLQLSLWLSFFYGWEIMEQQAYKSYIKQIQKYPLMTFEEEIEHSKLMQKGDNDAKMRLIQSNLRLVVSVAKKYKNPYVSIMDLIQEGNIGLLTAVSKYHYSFNTRFSTYAYAWIAQSITRFIRNKTGAILVPHRKEELVRKIHSARLVLFQKLSREPSDEEIAEKLGITLEEIKNANLYTFSYVSIDAETEENSGQNYKDSIPDYSFAPETRFFETVEKEKIQKMVKNLPEMERKVVEYRYNFQNDEKVKTLRQVGEELGVSAETVRQMEMRAKKQLRAVITSA